MAVRPILSPPTVSLSTSLLSLPPISRKPSVFLPLSCNSSRAGRGARCAAANKPSPSAAPGNEVSGSSSSSMAKIRSEVLSPFRSVRMFFYLAFMASGGLGSLIALTQLIPALGNPARAAGAAETLKGLGIDCWNLVLGHRHIANTNSGNSLWPIHVGVELSLIPHC